MFAWMKKYVLKFVMALIGLYATIWYADTYFMVGVFSLIPLYFAVSLIISLVKWVNNLDYDYSLDLDVIKTPKRPLPVKVKGIPEGMSFNDYLTKLNPPPGVRTTQE